MGNYGGRIASLRKKADLSQEDLSRMLGIQRVALSKIENDDRKISADELIKLSQIFNLTVEQLVHPELEPEILVVKEDAEYVNPTPLRISVPQRNIAKFKQALLYILNKVGAKPNIGQTVIYKLLYFIDFNYYEKYEEQLIGSKYIKNQHGPTPTEFAKVVGQMKRDGEIEEVKSKYFHHPQNKYLPLKTPDLSKLNANEIKMIDFVLERLSDMNATRISEYSHNDVPWMVAEMGKPMEYESVFYRTPAYSVREKTSEKSKVESEK